MRNWTLVHTFLGSFLGKFCVRFIGHKIPIKANYVFCTHSRTYDRVSFSLAFLIILVARGVLEGPPVVFSTNYPKQHHRSVVDFQKLSTNA